MSIKFKDNTGNKLAKDSVHYMPCKIHFDGEGKISQYFTYERQDSDGKDAEMTASFRGYPLCGKEIPVPEGYKGRIFKETSSAHFGNTSRNLKSTHGFDSLTFWNWDKPPSRADPFISALDWIPIAKAIHEDSED